MKNILVFNKHSNLIKEKSYRYDKHTKEKILRALERNNGNLLINSKNVRHYVAIAKKGRNTV